MTGGRVVLGLDVGSSSAKGIVFDENWSPLAQDTAAYRLHRSSAGAVELDPSEVSQAVSEMIARLAAATATARIDALAIASVGESVFPVDAEGTPLARAMTTLDMRLAGAASFWKDHLDIAQVQDLSGLPLRDMWSVHAMRAYLADAGISKLIAGFRTMEDAVVQALGVRPVMALSQAARTMLLDRRTADWSPALLATAGIAPTLLGNTARPGEVIGALPVARHGLAAGTLIVSGGHDQFVASLGAGGAPDVPTWSSGTVDSVIIQSRDSRVSDQVPTYLVQDGLYVRPVPNFNAGQAVDWLRQLCGDPSLSDLLETDAPDDDLVFVPTLGRVGAPEFGASRGGMIAGLTYGTGPSSIGRALLRGIVLETRQAVRRSGCTLRSATAITLAGGGSRSDYWCRLKAAAFGKPALRRTFHDAGCVGAAMLARQGLVGDLPAAEWVNPVTARFEPDPTLAARLDEIEDRYNRLRSQTVCSAGLPHE